MPTKQKYSKRRPGSKNRKRQKKSNKRVTRRVKISNALLRKVTKQMSQRISQRLSQLSKQGKRGGGSCFSTGNNYGMFSNPIPNSKIGGTDLFYTYDPEESKSITEKISSYLPSLPSLPKMLGGW